MDRDQQISQIAQAQKQIESRINSIDILLHTHNHSGVDKTRVIDGSLWLSSTAGYHLGGAVILYGSGTPEGVIRANLGSLYLRSDGGTTTTLYVKVSRGTTTNGWQAK